MVQGSSSELSSVASVVNSCATSCEGLAQQVASCLSSAGSWQDGAKIQFEEQFQSYAAQLQQIAASLQNAGGQISARAQQYQALESG